uniref:Uncharacterized protein n=1 Tax=Anguilla anguilla TaxID=7936 RepID=A0A0E9VDB9_ANGAN
MMSIGLPITLVKELL